MREAGRGGFVRAGEAAKYAPVTCGEYVQSRFDAAFAYRQKGAA